MYLVSPSSGSRLKLLPDLFAACGSDGRARRPSAFTVRIWATGGTILVAEKLMQECSCTSSNRSRRRNMTRSRRHSLIRELAMGAATVARRRIMSKQVANTASVGTPKESENVVHLQPLEQVVAILPASTGRNP